MQTMKNFEPTNYPKEKTLNPWNTHKCTKAQWYTTYKVLDNCQNFIQYAFLKKCQYLLFMTAFCESFSNSSLNPLELSEAATERCPLIYMTANIAFLKKKVVGQIFCFDWEKISEKMSK